MLRHIALTVLAIGFFVAGLVLYLQNKSTSNAGMLMLPSILMRCGMVMGAISLSLRQVQDFFKKYPPWLVGTVSLAVVVLVIRPQLIFIVGPLIVALGFLQFWGWLMTPPKKKQP